MTELIIALVNKIILWVELETVDLEPQETHGAQKPGAEIRDSLDFAVNTGERRMLDFYPLWN